MTEEIDECDSIIDNYEHPSKTVFYTLTHVPGKGCPEAYHTSLTSSCSCQQKDCTFQNGCSCLQDGDNYIVDDGRQILSDKVTPIFECNVNCSCSHCTNRCVQTGPRLGLAIFETLNKGLGLKTTELIKKGEFICEYAGEIISVEEACTRTKTSKEMNFIFVLKEHSNDGVIRTCVDPTYVGNIGRYINHSCQPNSVIVPVRVNTMVPKLGIFAFKDIPPDAEICYDYSFSLGNQFASNMKESTIGTKACYCLSTNCRKFLPFDDVL